MCEPRVKHILPALVIVPKVVLRIDLCIGGKFKLRSQIFCRQLQPNQRRWRPSVCTRAVLALSGAGARITGGSAHRAGLRRA